ncbi:uncharacterized protein EV422DRAFT_619343 [Fimicolochytrium jonesii]|uniref:uncharacterized protein n=1 Tax=Fimicolochytrium jonesii TaxID=1396493 RepID=UPI0022FDC5AC|nr:uncharacterized protein EV422DRAFT_619343 [Fimicolochytrium jonesii]KAI8822213.1 hypothetical protein EV422DRAFT_619343 [Fimicolochytrium jonesii]
MAEDELEQKFAQLCEKWRTSQELALQMARVVESLKAEIATLKSSQPPAEPEAPPTTYLGDFDTRYLELQKENQILNQIIKQYETTLEVVMGKFRSQAQSIQKDKHEQKIRMERSLKDERGTITHLRAENATLRSHLGTCLNVMRQAVAAADDTDTDALLAGLSKENQGLREMLGFSGIGVGSVGAGAGARAGQGVEGRIEKGVEQSVAG